MRHRKKGRVLGRSPSHRLALFRSLASALFLTERDAELDDNEPKVKGRIVTTLQKAKEVRPLVERCITIARVGLAAEDAARPYGTTAARNSEAQDVETDGHVPHRGGGEGGRAAQRTMRGAARCAVKGRVLRTGHSLAPR